MKSVTKMAPANLPLADGRIITLPADTQICLNLNGLHAHPRYRGADAERWRPDRWIEPDEKSREDRFLAPERGSYIAWSDGMRGCPGKKSAQVEHVAAMAAIFRDHGVDPVPTEGESLAAARNRTEGVARDAGVVLNLQMKNPDRLRVVWRRV